MEFLVKEAVLDFEKNKVKEFLSLSNLSYDKDIDYTLYIEDNEKIIATISKSDYIIKGLAVDEKYQGNNLAGILISSLITYFTSKHIYYYQVFTKPINKKVFENLNFREIITTSNTCLLETKNFFIENTLNKIKIDKRIDFVNNGCVVINANPFTLGHRYLIEEALKRHSKVIVFVLEEDKSFFSFKDRYALVKENLKDLNNIYVLPSTKYIISSITFPTYFLKNDVDEIIEEATVDALIFKKYFMPIFNISKRYVGSEKDILTNKYNNILKTILNEDIIEIERINNISASSVRKYYENNEFEKMVDLVSDNTIIYLRELKNGKY